jgi:ABC-type lipopolysaccharide export system ATPase subunit
MDARLQISGMTEKPIFVLLGEPLTHVDPEFIGKSFIIKNLQAG